MRAIVDALNVITAPITAYVATKGFRLLLPDEWSDLGTSRVKKDCRSLRMEVFEASHYDIFHLVDFSRSIESGDEKLV